MPEKQKVSSWKGIHAVIAAIAMVLLMALFNIIAIFDQHEDENNEAKFSPLLVTPSPPAMVMSENSNLTAMANQVVTRTRSS